MPDFFAPFANSAVRCGPSPNLPSRPSCATIPGSTAAPPRTFLATPRAALPGGGFCLWGELPFPYLGSTGTAEPVGRDGT
jgi:hypothetical protein